MTISTPPPPIPDNPPPMIRVYEEALDFQKKRAPMFAWNYYAKSMDEARPRAFTISGLQKMEHLHEANRLVEAAIAKNQTMSDFADELGALVDDHGGTILSPGRLELIYHNAMVNCAAAGQWRQAMEFPEDRPYFKYFGPLDGKTSRICRALQDVIVHYTDPILKKMWPPNHHWERHWWDSLAADEVNPDEVYKTPEGEEPAIGGSPIRPAEGFEYNPGEVFGYDDGALKRGAEKLGDYLPAKTASDYGLDAIGSMPLDTLPDAPALTHDVKFASDAAEWEAFKAGCGFPAGAERMLQLDYAKDGLWINRETFDHLGDAADPSKADRLSQVPSLLATLRDPAEVWLVPRKTASGDTVYTKRYFGAFRVAAEGRNRPRTTVLFVERSDDGWLMSSGWIKSNQKKLESWRQGLLVYSKVPRVKP